MQPVSMSGPLTNVLKLRPKSDELRKVLEEKIAYCKANEPGTITLRLFEQEDGVLQYYEDYESSEAFIAHVESAGERGVLDRLMATAEFEEVIVLGDPTPEAREVLAKFNATIATHQGGYSRLRLDRRSAQA